MWMILQFICSTLFNDVTFPISFFLNIWLICCYGTPQVLSFLAASPAGLPFLLYSWYWQSLLCPEIPSTTTSSSTKLKTQICIVFFYFSLQLFLARRIGQSKLVSISIKIRLFVVMFGQSEALCLAKLANFWLHVRATAKTHNCKPLLSADSGMCCCKYVNE